MHRFPWSRRTGHGARSASRPRVGVEVDEQCGAGAAASCTVIWRSSAAAQRAAMKWQGSIGSPYRVVNIRSERFQAALAAVRARFWAACRWRSGVRQIESSGSVASTPTSGPATTAGSEAGERSGRADVPTRHTIMPRRLSTPITQVSSARRLSEPHRLVDPAAGRYQSRRRDAVAGTTAADIGRMADVSQALIGQDQSRSGCGATKNI
jgi:hypothetical protein